LTNDENPQRAVDEIEHGTLDVLLSPPLNRLNELAVHYTSQFHSEPYAAVVELAMNTRVPPFNHVLARRALNYAIDRGRIVHLAGGPFAAQPTCQVLPPTLSGYRPYCPYTQNPAQAERGALRTYPKLSSSLMPPAHVR
jgi:peptide/nickel transport system substrate-binding protein